MRALVEGSGCRPLDALATRTGPASGSLQGRNPREAMATAVHLFLWGLWVCVGREDERQRGLGRFGPPDGLAGGRFGVC
jgi:hypothetical protein